MGRSPSDALDDCDMRDATYLRARAHHLRATAATARDPEIAEALRQVAGDFENEAAREEAQRPENGEERRAAGGKEPAA
jgi:hypothetical protein